MGSKYGVKKEFQKTLIVAFEVIKFRCWLRHMKIMNLANHSIFQVALALLLNIPITKGHLKATHFLGISGSTACTRNCLLCPKNV